MLGVDEGPPPLHLEAGRRDEARAVLPLAARLATGGLVVAEVDPVRHAVGNKRAMAL